ncbi:MAG: hypothetical protein ACOC6G_00525 [Thermoproteota archaeon]
MLSEAVSLSSQEIRGWLQKETKSNLKSIHREAASLLQEMKGDIERIIESAEILLEKSEKELNKGSRKTSGRAKALNKLATLFINRMQTLTIPEEVSYQKFHYYVRKTRKAFVSTEVDIKNWFPRISPYFILDRRNFESVYEESKETLKKLQTFLTQEYVEVKNLEETHQLIDDLLSEEEELVHLKTRKEESHRNQTSLQQEVKDIQQKIEDLQHRAGLNTIDHLNQEIKNLGKEVRRSFRHLTKPIEKFQRISLRRGGLSSQEFKILRQYTEKPFHFFATEEPGYPILKKILRKVEQSIDHGRLNLKQSRKRKAKEDIDQILHRNSLKNLHKKCRETVTQKEQLSTSPKTRKAKREIQELRKKLGRIKRRKKRIDLEKDRIQRDWDETLKQTRKTKQEIEQKLSDTLNRKIDIQLTI